MKSYSLCFFISVILFSLSVITSAQPIVSAKITPWKNNAKGVYTLIHDDFGMDIVSGIENYADTIAHNRGICFSFGPVTAQCDKRDWTNAKRLIAHGHEIINHSHSHFCGQEKDWCIWGNWSEKDFPVEIDTSSALIYKNTGVHPGFFIFPYDLYTDTMVNYLRTRPYYYGARAGFQDQFMKPDFTDPFRVNFTVFRPENSVEVLDSFVTQTIREGVWGVRVVHGVNDQSWAGIPLESYRNHLNFVRSKMMSGEVWVATVRDVIHYKKARDSYSILATSSSKKIIIKFIPQSGYEVTDAELSVDVAVDLELSKTKITILQKGKVIQPVTKNSNSIIFNANPAEGTTIEIRME